MPQGQFDIIKQCNMISLTFFSSAQQIIYLWKVLPVVPVKFFKIIGTGTKQ